MASTENKGSAAKSTSPRTPYVRSSSATDVPSPALVGVYPSAESRNNPFKVMHTTGAIEEQGCRMFLGASPDLMSSPLGTCTDKLTC